MMSDSKGLHLCLRYAYAPNSLHYCGPERQNEAKGYLMEGAADQGLAEILDEFDTLYNYLIFIASQNNIPDPFDPRVVEAYWIGNSLLDYISKKGLVSHFTDSLNLKQKLPSKKLHPMLDGVANQGFPHHNFHVLNVFVRTGHHAIAHTLETMDCCRISWGKIVEEVSSSKYLVSSKNKISGKQFLVETKSLVYDKEVMRLSSSVKKGVISLINHPKVGDWVSVHWGIVCDILTEDQVKRLAFLTRRALASANRLI